MSKIFLYLVICSFFFITNESGAQTGSNHLSIGPSVGFPLNFDETHEVGVGAGLRGYFGAGPGSILVNVNVISFPNKFIEKNLNLTSVKIGYTSSLTRPGLFGYFDVGLTADNRSGQELVPALGFGLGYGIPVRNGGTIDIVPNFNVAFYPNMKRTWIDLHLAYRFAVGGR